MNSDFTFVFDNDGKAHAMKEGKVVASADSVEQLEAIVKQAAPPMLGNGSSGAGVSDLQNSLGVNADGQFGPQTEQAVKDYQQQNNLTADGVVGPDTMNSFKGDELKGMIGDATGTAGEQSLISGQPPSALFPKFNPPGSDAGKIPPLVDERSPQFGVRPESAPGFTPPPAGSALQSQMPGNGGGLIDNAASDLASGAANAAGDLYRSSPEDMVNGAKDLVGGAANAVGDFFGGGNDAPSMRDPSPKMPNGVPPTKGMGQIFGSKEAKDCNCWDGYDRVPGTKPCSEGSCKKCDDHRSKESATHVITPNGLKGRILGKTKDMWGDTVTVRFENGRIVQFPTSDSLRYASEQEEVLSVTASLRERLNAPIEGDSESLVSRINELKSIRREAQVKIANGDVSFEDESELDNIAVESDAELGQVVAALDHINDENTDAYRPPTMHVAEQASLGGNDGTWLDDAFSTMVSEASSTDYDKLMSEGPEAFVAELNTAALANAGATREIASSHIRSKTAGANPQARNSFETAWIDRVETLRRKEILNRKTKAKKEAAAETDHSNLPDDILFG